LEGNFLISDKLYDLVSDVPKDFKIDKKEFIDLKVKKKPMELMSIFK